jgi:hypothetical protein
VVPDVIGRNTAISVTEKAGQWFRRVLLERPPKDCMFALIRQLPHGYEKFAADRVSINKKELSIPLRLRIRLAIFLQAALGTVRAVALAS